MPPATGLAEKGYDERMGARPLARVIQEHVKKPLAEEVLFGRLKNGGTVRVITRTTEAGDTVLDFEYPSGLALPKPEPIPRRSRRRSARPTRPAPVRRSGREPVVKGGSSPVPNEGPAQELSGARDQGARRSLDRELRPLVALGRGDPPGPQRLGPRSRPRRAPRPAPKRRARGRPRADSRARCARSGPRACAPRRPRPPRSPRSRCAPSAEPTNTSGSVAVQSPTLPMSRAPRARAAAIAPGREGVEHREQDVGARIDFGERPALGQRRIVLTAAEAGEESRTPRSAWATPRRRPPDPRAGLHAMAREMSDDPLRVRWAAATPARNADCSCSTTTEPRLGPGHRALDHREARSAVRPRPRSERPCRPGRRPAPRGRFRARGARPALRDLRRVRTAGRLRW